MPPRKGSTTESRADIVEIDRSRLEPLGGAVEEFLEVAALARRKPARALKGFMALKVPPSALPLLYEEAARVLAGTGHPVQASRAFELSCQAEARQRPTMPLAPRIESLRSFVSLGVVSDKSLLELAQTLSSPEDMALFQEIYISRVRLGAPPSPRVNRALRQLAIRARLDVGEEDKRFLRAILDAPALSLAPAELFEEYAEAFEELAAEDEGVKNRLLRLRPSVVRRQGEFFEDDRAVFAAWIRLLDSTGALDCLTQDDVAHWLSSVLSMDGRDPVSLHILLHRLAPVLRAQSHPLPTDTLDLDTLDLALELGLPLADPPPHGRLDILPWAYRLMAHPKESRKLTYLSQDERFKGLLASGMGRLFSPEGGGSGVVIRALLGVEALEPLLGEHLASLVQSLEATTVTGFQEALVGIQRVLSTGLLDRFPAQRRRLGEVRVAGALQRTLRGGIMDEFGWPVLEEAVAEVEALGQGRAFVEPSFPYLVVGSRHRAVVVSPSERVAEFALELPEGSYVQAARYAGGELFVGWLGESRRLQGLWTSAPREIFDYGDCGKTLASIPWEGGVVERGRVIRPGEREFNAGPLAGPVFSDGRSFWGRHDKDAPGALRALDPLTGTLGALSRPPFLGEPPEPGYTLDLEHSYLLPLPEGVEGPLGAKGGVMGWRTHIARADPTRVHCQGIDGRSWRGSIEELVPLALVTFPGDTKPRPLTPLPQGFTLWDHQGQHPLARYRVLVGPWLDCRRTPAILPFPFWNLRVPRDPEGSQALRGLDLQTCQALVETAMVELGDQSWLQDRPLSATEAQVRAMLPQVTHPRLQEGIAGIAAHAALVARHLRLLVRDHAGKGR